MGCCNVYENHNMRELMGETLRPGGFKLTEKSMDFCKFTAKDKILDLGCGTGATVGYLKDKYEIYATGLDPSENFLEIARKKYGYAAFIKGKGEMLPFDRESFDGVLAECTLSLMEDLEATINEVSRVLKTGGWFVIHDVYAKNPVFIEKLKENSFNSCMRGLHDLTFLRKELVSKGFQLIGFEDCSYFLKELFVKIIFSYGSMGIFWRRTTNHCIDGDHFQDSLKKCKPGYFWMACRKGGRDDE